MNETVKKPMSIVRQEFIEQLVNDINQCSLPLFVVEPILQDLLTMVKTESQRQYAAEKAQYDAQLALHNESNHN